LSSIKGKTNQRGVSEKLLNSELPVKRPNKMLRSRRISRGFGF